MTTSRGPVCYLVISPVRDEEKRIEKTIFSMLNQSILPCRYCLVDDGSTDRTGAIIDTYARNYPWITALHRPDRGFRNSAGGEIDAFYAGFHEVNDDDWEFVVKLDGDLSFAPTYFERLFAFFRSQPKLGIGSGTIYNLTQGGIEKEEAPRFHVRGAAKTYRRACWEAIGGMATINGWDTLDEVKANMLGWQTRNFPDLMVLQHRPTGQAVGTWSNAVKNGRGSYASGYHPLYLLVKCCTRIFRKPYFVEAAGLLYGFMSAYFTRTPRIGDSVLVSYLRRQQLRRLCFQPTIWE